jgi:hypothetical protein
LESRCVTENEVVMLGGRRHSGGQAEAFPRTHTRLHIVLKILSYRNNVGLPPDLCAMVNTARPGHLQGEDLPKQPGFSRSSSGVSFILLLHGFKCKNLDFCTACNGCFLTLLVRSQGADDLHG